MSAPVIEFPIAADGKPPRPAKPTWTATINFAEGIELGIDKYDDGTFVMFRRIGQREDYIVAPSLDVAITLLMYAFHDAYWSEAADEIAGDVLEAAQDQLNDLIRELRPYAAILGEADFAPFDLAVKELRHKKA